MKTVNIEESRYSANAGVDLRKAVYGVLSFAVIALLLNASALEKNLMLMEFGARRDISLSFIKPVSFVSCFLHIDIFREWIESQSILEG